MTPPSVNRPRPYSLDIRIPAGKYYRVDIVVKPERRLGDVDNRIKPVLEALERNGLIGTRVQFITCRFGKENSVKVTAYDR